MDKNMPIASLTGFLGCIYDILGALLGKKGSPGGKASPTGGTGNQSVNASGGIVVINQNITINHVKYEEVSKQFSLGTQKLLLAKDKESGIELVMEWKQNAPEYLAIGYYARCSFGDKKDLPVWVGFQPKEPSKGNTLDSMTFGVALLGRETWEEAGIERSQLDKHGYEEERKETKGENTHYKWVDGIKLGADAKALREGFESELKTIEKMLS